MFALDNEEAWSPQSEGYEKGEMAVLCLVSIHFSTFAAAAAFVFANEIFDFRSICMPCAWQCNQAEQTEYRNICMYTDDSVAVNRTAWNRIWVKVFFIWLTLQFIHNRFSANNRIDTLKSNPSHKQNNNVDCVFGAFAVSCALPFFRFSFATLLSAQFLLILIDECSIKLKQTDSTFRLVCL